MNHYRWEAMIRTMAVCLGAALMVSGLWSASAVSQELENETVTFCISLASE
jgi:hypothetical protein